MNRFSASIILYQVTPQTFLDMSDEERIDKFSHFIGVHALETFNAEMLVRYQTLDITGSSLTDNISDGLYPLP